MKLFRFYCAFAVLSPFILYLVKLIGLITWSWGWVLFISLMIPFIMFSLLLAFVVWVIKSIPPGEWNN